MIEFKNVTKKYPGGRYALNKVNFQVERGEFIYVIGQSGAGKTTILRLLIAESKPTTGKIVFNGHEIQNFSKGNIAKLRRKIRMVFQDFKVLYDRTILENVMLSLYIIGRSGKEAEAEAKKVLKMVGLEDRITAFPIELSAGELQRVAIARALAGGSEVLLADEPTGNLDPKTGEEIMALLETINREGTTVIVTTHNVAFVNERKKRVMEVANGEIIRDDKEGGYSAAR